jgi:type II secretory pathway pseudopilin PulG
MEADRLDEARLERDHAQMAAETQAEAGRQRQREEQVRQREEQAREYQQQQQQQQQQFGGRPQSPPIHGAGRRDPNAGGGPTSPLRGGHMSHLDQVGHCPMYSSCS